MATDENRKIMASGSWYGKAIGAGIIGGIVMGLYMMIVTLLLGRGFWTPMKMIAAVFPAYRPPIEGSAASAAAGLFLHMLTSAFWGAAFAWITRAFPRNLAGAGISTLWGLVYGVAVWLVMGEGIGPWLSPPIDKAPAVNFFVGHLLFGMATAWSLYAWTKDYELPFAKGAQGRWKGPLGMRPT